MVGTGTDGGSLLRVLLVRAVHGVDAPAQWDKYHRHVYAGLQNADVVVAPTRAMLTALHQHYGQFHKQAVIYNGRCAQDFQPGEKEQVIFSIGRLWDDAKNIAALEAVAPHITWPIYVAGSNHHPDGGERQLDQVHPLGILRAREISEWLRKTAIYVLPARYEPFGLSALEAALAGCTLVLSDIPSLRELWDGHALFVPPDDPAALQTALVRLIGDENLRSALSTVARQRAVKLSSARMAQRYMTLYHALVQQQKATAKHRVHRTPAPVTTPVAIPRSVVQGEFDALHQSGVSS
ncbi:MAG: glycosyltransferase family 4 protein [Caldilineaceae bacterium]